MFLHEGLVLSLAKYVISFYHKQYHPMILSALQQGKDILENLQVPDENPMSRLTFLVIKEMCLLGYCALPTRSYLGKTLKKWTYAKSGIYEGNIVLLDMVKSYKNIILNELICFSTFHPLKWICPPIIPHIIKKYDALYPSLYKEIFGMLASEGWLFYNPIASDHLLEVSNRIMNSSLKFLQDLNLTVFYGNVDSLMFILEELNEDELVSSLNQHISEQGKQYKFVVKERHRKIEVEGIRKYHPLQ